jgi:hypothetical protein
MFLRFYLILSQIYVNFLGNPKIITYFYDNINITVEGYHVLVVGKIVMWGGQLIMVEGQCILVV